MEYLFPRAPDEVIHLIKGIISLPLINMQREKTSMKQDVVGHDFRHHSLRSTYDEDPSNQS